MKKNDTSFDRLNRDLSTVTCHIFSQPTNEFIAWAAFRDRNESLQDPNKEIADPYYLKLVDDIELETKKYIENNVKDIDFSSYEKAKNSIQLSIQEFISEEYKSKLENLFYKEKRSPFITVALVIVAYREFALLAFLNLNYLVAMELHKYSNEVHTHTIYSKVLFVDHFKQEMSFKNKKGNDARWQGRVESLRRKYLELDTKRQSELGKKLTIKAVATWICNYRNPEELEFETIRDHLSKARKGIFTND
tara:strand:- start:711 stop:1457 length:747 start_codon:yes stop_codon:yes gene_type:complete